MSWNPNRGGVVGRASNRKKAQREAGPGSRQARRDSRADAATQRMTDPLAGGLRALVQLARERVEREAAALPAWRGGAEPVSAETPQWPEGSLGDRFLAGTYVWEALDAPCLLTAEIPDATVIAANPAHWNIATSALVRAVIFDGLALDHPAVSMLLEVLAPIAEAELVHGLAIEAWLDRGGPYSGEPGSEFPEQDGPVYLRSTAATIPAMPSAAAHWAPRLQPAGDPRR
jgi:hypothetical protein